MVKSWFAGTTALARLVAGMALLSSAYGQGRGVPGKPIGSIAVRGSLIVMTLDEGVLGKESLFDLVHRTLRFTPAESQYRVENVAWKWDPEFGSEMSGSQAAMKSFAFPFSGKTWNSFSVGVTGSIAFGETAAGRGGRGGGCLNLLFLGSLLNSGSRGGWSGGSFGGSSGGGGGGFGGFGGGGDFDGGGAGGSW